MFVGLDVHKNYLQAAVVDKEGTLLKEERIPNQIDEIEKFFADVDDAKIVIESSSAWYHIYEHLSKHYHVVLSNPVKTKAIASARVKTDRLDARASYTGSAYVYRWTDAGAMDGVPQTGETTQVYIYTFT
jgi:transposase